MVFRDHSLGVRSSHRLWAGHCSMDRVRKIYICMCIGMCLCICVYVWPLWRMPYFYLMYANIFIFFFLGKRVAYYSSAPCFLHLTLYFRDHSGAIYKVFHCILQPQRLQCINTPHFIHLDRWLFLVFCSYTVVEWLFLLVEVYLQIKHKAGTETLFFLNWMDRWMGSASIFSPQFITCLFSLILFFFLFKFWFLLFFKVFI